jgi:hypothetical protein
MIYKIISLALIIFGGLFTIAAIYISFIIEESLEIIIGWLFLGPLPLVIGILFYRFIKSKSELTARSKMGIKKQT